MDELLTDLRTLREEWDVSRAEWQATNLQKGTETFGWWDACCCIVHDLDALINKHGETLSDSTLVDKIAGYLRSEVYYYEKNPSESLVAAKKIIELLEAAKAGER